jgi:hypothetical protein
MDHRLSKRANTTITQVLIKWSQLPAKMATWEDYHVVKKRFLKAPAWGQPVSQGRGIVMPDGSSTTSTAAQMASGPTMMVTA